MPLRNIFGVEIDVVSTEANTLYFDANQASKLNDFHADSIKNFLFEQIGNHRPISVLWELSNNCNFRCGFCYINCLDKKEVPIRSLQEDLMIAEALINAGMLFCTLTGGECLLYPHFEALYQHLKEHGVLVTVFTNGSLLTDDHLSLFEEYPPYQVEISLYGITDNAFQKVTGVSVEWKERVEDAVLQLQGNKTIIRCKTPINSLTEDQISLIASWCEEHQIEYYTSPELLPTYTGNKLLEFEPSKECIEEYRSRNIRDKQIHSDGVFSKKHTFDCPAGKTNAFLSFDSYLYPCSSAYGISALAVPIHGNSAANDIKRLSDLIDSMRGQELSFCLGCRFQNVCDKCILDEYNSSIHPDSCDYFIKKMRM